MLKIVLSISVLALVVSACSSQSKAVFQRASTDADSDLVIKNAASGGDLFVMPTSKLVVSSAATPPANPVAPAEPGQPKPQDPGGAANHANHAPAAATQAGSASSSTSQITVGKASFGVTVVPVESSHKYLVNPVNDFFTSSQVNIAKMPNTDIPSSVSSQFTDNTATRIDQIGGLVTAVIAILPLLAAQNPDEQNCQLHPQNLQPFTLNLDSEVKDLSPLNGQACWKYAVIFDSATPSAGAVSWSRFDQDLGNSVSYFPVPACRDATILLDGYVASTAPKTPASHVNVAIHTKVADPQYLRLAPLPSKGQISMHPICGADVTDAPPDRFGAYMNDATEALKQAKSIESAAGGKQASK